MLVYNNLDSVIIDYPEFNIVSYEQYQPLDYKYVNFFENVIKIETRLAYFPIEWKYCIAYKGILYPYVSYSTTKRVIGHNKDNLDRFKNYIDMVTSDLYKAIEGEKV